MAVPFASDRGVAVCIPVDCRAVDRIADLVPTLEAPALESQRTQDLPPGLDQVEIGRKLGLEHYLPARMREQKQYYACYLGSGYP